MIEVVQKRLIHWNNQNEQRRIFEAIASLQKDIVVYGNTSKLRNFSNIISLSLSEKSLFDPSLLDTFPVEIFSDLLLLLIEHHSVDQIGIKCFEFLVNCIRNLRQQLGNEFSY